MMAYQNLSQPQQMNSNNIRGQNNPQQTYQGYKAGFAPN